MWQYTFAYLKLKSFFSHLEIWDLNNRHVRFSSHLDMFIIQAIKFISYSKMFHGTMMLEWNVCVSMTQIKDIFDQKFSYSDTSAIQILLV